MKTYRSENLILVIPGIGEAVLQMALAIERAFNPQKELVKCSIPQSEGPPQAS
jgi:hypothetical protein